MSNGHDKENPPPPDRAVLQHLSAKISARRQRQNPPPAGHANANMLGFAWRLTIEILVGIGVGGFIGWWMDVWFNTAPVFLLIMLVLGMAAGLWGVVRMVAQMRQQIDEQAEQAKQNKAKKIEDENGQ